MLKLQCPNCRKINDYPRTRKLYKYCKCTNCGESFKAIDALYYTNNEDLIFTILHTMTRIEEKLDGH